MSNLPLQRASGGEGRGEGALRRAVIQISTEAPAAFIRNAGSRPLYPRKQPFLRQARYGER